MKVHEQVRNSLILSYIIGLDDRPLMHGNQDMQPHIQFLLQIIGKLKWNGFCSQASPFKTDSYVFRI